MISSKNKHGFSVISLMVTGCFFWSNIVYANPLLKSSYTHLFAASAKTSPKIENLEIPVSFGTVHERYLSPSLTRLSTSPSSFLIHIQDAHSSVEAQKNIKNILNYAHERYGVDLVLVEGAIGKLDPSLLNYFPEKELNEKTVQLLSEKGILGGPELFLFDQMQKGNSKVKAYGVEDLKLYKKNLEAFRRVYSQKQESEIFLEALKLRLASHASKIFNKKLREFFREWLFHQNNPAQFKRHLDLLKKAAKKELGVDFDNPRSQINFPQLARYYALQQLEERLNVAKNSNEIDTLLKWANEVSLSEESIHGLSKWKAGDFERSSLRSFLEQLYFEGSKKGFDFKKYKCLSMEWGIAILQSELQPEDLIIEIEKLAQTILDCLALNENEKKLMDIYKDYLILIKTFSLELSRPEYRKVLERKEILKPFVLSQRLKAIDNTAESLDLTGKADLLYADALEFYQLAVAREEKLFQHALERMKQEGKTKAAFITGGFHAEGLQDYLKETGFSYAEVTPRISEINSSEDYVRLMLLNPSVKTAYLALGRYATDPLLRSEMRKDLKRLEEKFIEPVLGEMNRIGEAGKSRSEMRNETMASLQQELIDLIREPIEFLSAGDDLEKNRPDAFLVLGNPDLKTFLEFSKLWKKSFRGVPIVLAGGRGRGTKPLALAMLSHYAHLQEEEKELLRKAARNEVIYETQLLRLIFEQEKIPVSHLRDESDHSTKTDENFKFTLDPLEEVLNGNKKIGIVTAPQLSGRVSIIAQVIWEENKKTDWIPVKVKTYPINWDEISIDELLGLAGYVFGFPPEFAQEFINEDTNKSFLSVLSEFHGMKSALESFYGKDPIPEEVLKEIDRHLGQLELIRNTLVELIKSSGATYDPSLNRFVVSRSEVRTSTRRKFLGALAVGIGIAPDVAIAQGQKSLNPIEIEGLEQFDPDVQKLFSKAMQEASKKAENIFNSPAYQEQEVAKLRIAKLERPKKGADGREKNFAIYLYRGLIHSQAFFFDLEDINGKDFWKKLVLVLIDLETLPGTIQFEWRRKLPLNVPSTIQSQQELITKARSFNLLGVDAQNPLNPKYNNPSYAQKFFEKYLREFLDLPQNSDLKESLIPIDEQKHEILTQYIKDLFEKGILPEKKTRSRFWEKPQFLFGVGMALVASLLSLIIIYFWNKSQEKTSRSKRENYESYFSAHFKRVHFFVNRLIDRFELGHPFFSLFFLGINYPLKGYKGFLKDPEPDDDDKWNPLLAYVSLSGKVRNLYGWPTLSVMFKYLLSIFSHSEESRRFKSMPWLFPEEITPNFAFDMLFKTKFFSVLRMIFWLSWFNLFVAFTQLAIYILTVPIAFWWPVYKLRLNVADKSVKDENMKRLFTAIQESLKKMGVSLWVRSPENADIDPEMIWTGLASPTEREISWASPDRRYGMDGLNNIYLDLRKLDFQNLPADLKGVYAKQTDGLQEQLQQALEYGLDLKGLKRELDKVLKKLNAGEQIRLTDSSNNAFRRFLYETAYEFYKAINDLESKGAKKTRQPESEFSQLKSSQQMIYFIPFWLALQAHLQPKKTSLLIAKNKISRSEMREETRNPLLQQAIIETAGIAHGILSLKVKLEQPELFQFLLSQITPEAAKERRMSNHGDFQEAINSFIEMVNALVESGDLTLSQGVAVLDADLFDQDPEFALLFAAFQAKFADNQTLIVSGENAPQVERIILDLFNNNSEKFKRLSPEDRARLHSGIEFENTLSKARFKAKRATDGAITYQNTKQNAEAGSLDFLPFVQLQKEKMALLDRVKAQFFINQLMITASHKIPQKGDVCTRLMTLAVEINKKVPDAVTLTEDGRLAQISPVGVLKFFNAKAYQRLQASA